MTSTETDVSGVGQAVAGMQIDGPETPAATDETTVEVTFANGETTGPIPAGALFDKAEYLEAPVIEGHVVDEIAISFSGTIKYDANDEAGKTLLAALRLGKPVDLQVGGFVAKKPSSYRLDREGDAIVTGAAGVKIETVRLLRPEDLA